MLFCCSWIVAANGEFAVFHRQISQLIQFQQEGANIAGAAGVVVASIKQRFAVEFIEIESRQLSSK